MPFVYSTLTAGNTYVDYHATVNGVPTAVRSVAIAGGTNVPNKHLVTPMGVVTEVTDDELEFLEKDPGFIFHREKGFLKVQKTKANPEKVAADMETRDASAPAVPQDFKDGLEPTAGLAPKKK